MDVVDLPLGHPAWVQALDVLGELRPHLTRDLLDQVLSEGAPQGLRFIGAFEDQRCLGVAGWRVVATTSAVRKLYVDDLVTTSGHRSRGVGSFLLEALRERAHLAGARLLDLDSGVQRHAAHRFYLHQRMDITAHHFAQPL